MQKILMIVSLAVVSMGFTHCPSRSLPHRGHHDDGAQAGRGGGGDGDGDTTAPDPGDGPFCGGIAGIQCPGAGACVDDPNDDCDPQSGGADCGGVCECNAAAISCLVGTILNDDPNVCACEPPPGAGEPCGSSTCAEGEVCCNASCGICVPPDGVCIQIACD